MVNAGMSPEGRHAAVDDSPAGIAKASGALIGRALAASLGCGLVAGLASSVPCFARAVPLIKDAEAYEGDDGLCADGNSMDPACQDDGAWAPSEAARDWCTLVSNVWIGVAYAAIALSLALARACPLDANKGVQLGLVGFLAFQVMPALGLSPELPGMLAANEYARQSWWVLCALCTLAGAWLSLADPPGQLLL